MTSRLCLFKNDLRSSKSKLCPDQIAALAFHLYLKEGGPDGKELEIWRRAKKILREKTGQKKSTGNRAEPGLSAASSARA